MTTLLIGPAIILIGVVFVGSLINWRFGLLGLLIYLPFAGLISLRSGQSALALLAKDVLFAIPAYVIFFATYPQPFNGVRFPKLFVAALIALTVLVVAEAVNPNVPNFLVAIIGIKVWLFYIPLCFISAAAIKTKDDLVHLLRILAIVAVIPLTFGLLQLLGIELLGNQAASSLFFGENLDSNNYDLFAGFDEYGNGAGGTLYRINSTFSSTGQYYIYTLSMIPLVFALIKIDPVRAWRFFARVLVLALVFAAFLSGARGAGLFVPIVFAPILLFGRRPGAIVVWALLIPLAYIVSLTLIGIDVSALLADTASRAVGYSQEYAWDKVAFVLTEYPAGLGSGMNTNAARYAFSAGGEMTTMLIGIESYYIKSIVELSCFGLFPVLIIIFAPLVRAINLSRFGQSNQIRQCAAAFSGFFLMVAILSMRAWPLDVDPVNVMFWVLVGVLYKLPSIMLTMPSETNTARQVAMPFTRSAMPTGT